MATPRAGVGDPSGQSDALLLRLQRLLSRVPTTSDVELRDAATALLHAGGISSQGWGVLDHARRFLGTGWAAHALLRHREIPVWLGTQIVAEEEYDAAAVVHAVLAHAIRPGPHCIPLLVRGDRELGQAVLMHTAVLLRDEWYWRDLVTHVLEKFSRAPRPAAIDALLADPTFAGHAVALLGDRAGDSLSPQDFAAALASPNDDHRMTALRALGTIPVVAVDAPAERSGAPAPVPITPTLMPGR